MSTSLRGSAARYRSCGSRAKTHTHKVPGPSRILRTRHARCHDFRGTRRSKTSTLDPLHGVARWVVHRNGHRGRERSGRTGVPLGLHRGGTVPGRPTGRMPRRPGAWQASVTPYDVFAQRLCPRETARASRSLHHCAGVWHPCPTCPGPAPVLRRSSPPVVRRSRLQRSAVVAVACSMGAS